MHSLSSSGFTLIGFGLINCTVFNRPFFTHLGLFNTFQILVRDSIKTMDLSATSLGIFMVLIVGLHGARTSVFKFNQKREPENIIPDTLRWHEEQKYFPSFDTKEEDKVAPQVVEDRDDATDLPPEDPSTVSFYPFKNTSLSWDDRVYEVA